MTIQILANEVSTDGLFKAQQGFPRRLFKTIDEKLVDGTLSPVTIEKRCNNTLKAMKRGIVSIPLKWWGVDTEGNKDYVYPQDDIGWADGMLTSYDARVLLGKDFPEPKLSRNYMKSPLANLKEDIKLRAILAAASQTIIWDHEIKYNAFYITSFKKGINWKGSTVSLELYKIPEAENARLAYTEAEKSKISKKMDEIHFFDWCSGKRYSGRP